MLRYTVASGEEPHAAFNNWDDAREWARQISEEGRLVRVGFTPMGKHHRTIETWENGKRVHD